MTRSIFCRNLTQTARRAIISKVITARCSSIPFRPVQLPQARFQSTDSKTAQAKGPKPELMIAFKCKKCDTRSSHVISKQAYTKGTILVTCPGCQNRHLIADHLKIFSDDRITIEDILSAKGESVSQSIDDLVFDEIPERLKRLIGHHAKDAPQKKEKVKEGDKTYYLPEDKK